MKTFLRIIPILFFSVFVISTAHAQLTAKERAQIAIEKAKNGWWTESMETRDKRVAWWNEARFGMFVHWGVYSVPAGVWKDEGIGRSYSEHLMRIKEIPVTEYKEKLAATFNPVDFNADQWIKTAKDAGMKYFIITAKHHDGFAMYDSDVSPYNIVDWSVFHRDPMIELKQACKKYGIKFGFYYSHAFDWEHPDAPGNDWDYENPGGGKLLFGGRNYFDHYPELIPRMAKYVNQKSIPQIKELLIKYEPDIMWFDTPHKLAFFENLRILEELRKIAPDVVVNGRLVGGFGDYQNTADKPLELFPTKAKYWEAIPTTNESYGYNKVDDSHKPASHFIKLLSKTSARGGNLLMNVGPKGDGTIDSVDVEILTGIGNWLNINGEAIYKTKKTLLPVQSWGETTINGNKLYLHIHNYPKGKLTLGGLKNEVHAAYLLADPAKKPLAFNKDKSGDFHINIPVEKSEEPVIIVVLECGEDIEYNGTSRLIAANQVNTLHVFDGKLKGETLKYGSGNHKQNCIFNWKDKNDFILWDYRLEANTKFDVFVLYDSEKGSEGNRCEVTIGGKKLSANVVPEAGYKKIQIGTVNLKKGSDIITIKAIDISSTELMKLREVVLEPVL